MQCVILEHNITFTKEQTVDCCNCDGSNGLIELPNHCVAVSGGKSSTIDVIDTETYQLVTRITCEGYIGDSNANMSCIHLLNNGTLIYFLMGSFC